MKKLIALLVIGLFVIGLVPAVLADDDTSSNEDTTDDSVSESDENNEQTNNAKRERFKNWDEKTIREKLAGLSKLSDEQRRKLLLRVNQRADLEDLDLDEEQAKILAGLNRVRLNEILDICQEDKEACKEELKKYRIKKFTKAKESSEQELKQARLKFLQAKKRFDYHNEQADEARSEFLRLKESGATDEELTQAAKEFVVNSAKRLQAHLTKVMEKVEENNRDEDVLDELEDAIEKLDEIIANAEIATTKEEIQAQAQELKQFHQQYKHRVKVHAQRALQGATKSVYRSSEKAVSVLECAYDELSASDVDVSDLQTAIDGIIDAQTLAHEHLETAKRLFNEARSSDDKDEAQRFVQSARKELQKAHEAMKSVPQHLKSGVRFVNANEPGLLGECRASLQDDEDYEVVEEAEEEIEEAIVEFEDSDDASAA